MKILNARTFESHFCCFVLLTVTGMTVFASFVISPEVAEGTMTVEPHTPDAHVEECSRE